MERKLTNMQSWAQLGNILSSLFLLLLRISRQLWKLTPGHNWSEVPTSAFTRLLARFPADFSNSCNDIRSSLTLHFWFLKIVRWESVEDGQKSFGARIDPFSEWRWQLFGLEEKPEEERLDGLEADVICKVVGDLWVLATANLELRWCNKLIEQLELEFRISNEISFRNNNFYQIEVETQGASFSFSDSSHPDNSHTSDNLTLWVNSVFYFPLLSHFGSARHFISNVLVMSIKNFLSMIWMSVVKQCISEQLLLFSLFQIMW